MQLLADILLIMNTLNPGVGASDFKRSWTAPGSLNHAFLEEYASTRVLTWCPELLMLNHRWIAPGSLNVAFLEESAFTRVLTWCRSF